jgi:hypothetical protein
MGPRPQFDPEIRRAAALTWPMNCELVGVSHSVGNMAISGSWLACSTHVYVEMNFASESAGEENE